MSEKCMLECKSKMYVASCTAFARFPKHVGADDTDLLGELATCNFFDLSERSLAYTFRLPFGCCCDRKQPSESPSHIQFYKLSHVWTENLSAGAPRFHIIYTHHTKLQYRHTIPGTHNIQPRVVMLCRYIMQLAHIYRACTRVLL